MVIQGNQLDSVWQYMGNKIMKGTNHSKLIGVTARENLSMTIFCLRIIKSFAEHGRDWVNSNLFYWFMLKKHKRWTSD